MINETKYWAAVEKLRKIMPKAEPRLKAIRTLAGKKMCSFRTATIKLAKNKRK